MRFFSSLLSILSVAVATTNSIVNVSAVGTSEGVFKHMMVMMFENQGYPETLKNVYWDSSVRGGLLLTSVSGITHPSQCNYVGQIGGSMFGCTGDSDYSTNATSIVDLFDHAVPTPISWKSYQEDYVPGKNGDCNMATSINGLYYRKHNPFMSYSMITSNLTRCQNIVNADQFAVDAKAGTLPQFIYYTPNINNDAHNTGLDVSGKYLQTFLKTYLPYLKDVLLYITWDEDAYLDNNHIVSILYGPGITANTQDDGTVYNQYSVGASIEENWNLGNLGRNDATAKSFLSAAKSSKPREDQPEYIKETPEIILERKERCDNLDNEFTYTNEFRVRAEKEAEKYKQNKPSNQ